MRTNYFSLFRKTILASLIGFGLFALVLVGLLVGFHLSYTDRIYPGVQVGWADVSGLTIEEATELLANEYTYPNQGLILLRDGQQYWSLFPSQVGLFLGSEYNARTAYDLGRSGPSLPRQYEIFNAWYRGTIFPITMLFDERIAQETLERIASQIDTPTVEASLRVDGTEVSVLPGQVGRSMDVSATLQLIKARVETLLDGEIVPVISETSPVILDATEQAAIAESILSEPLVLKLPDAQDGDPGPWTFGREELARMLVIERVTTSEGETYQVELSSQLLRNFLESKAPETYIQRVNAQFMFNDETQELELIQPSITGQYLDIDASLTLINETLASGEHEIILDMEYILPDVSSKATAESLGITELVSSYTSYFYGSSTSRKQNIATAAFQFYGVLVGPGETFSMADILGDVSLDTGYAEAWIIYGDRTIKGVGGGVCQVSTTLFRTVFFGGYPIVQRHPQNWLLMETYVGNSYLTWKFYSTGDGRTVEWETTGLTNIQDPPDPLYQENSDLTEGEIKQVDWSVKGADVTVTRYVHLDDEIIYNDIFVTHYMPWRAVYEYGPGTEGMPPEDD
jgi:vancomycin resistance protein YoaR